METSLLTQGGKLNTVNDIAGCNTQVSEKSSYSQVTTEHTYEDNYVPPTIEQGLIVDSFEKVPINEYLRAFATKIEAAKILFISRISQQRVCVYVDSTKTAQELIKEENNVLTVMGYNTIIRPIQEKSRRVVISNVSPLLPNKSIIQKLKESGITPKSNITLIRAGINEAAFKHVASFRRQVYISPTDVPKLPGNILLSHRINNIDMVFQIYLSAETISCFHCKERGHIERHCPKINEATVTEELLRRKILSPENKNKNNNTLLDNEVEVNSDSMEVDPHGGNNSLSKFNLPKVLPTKRPRPQNSDTNSSTSFAPIKKKSGNEAEIIAENKITISPLTFDLLAQDISNAITMIPEEETFSHHS